MEKIKKYYVLIFKTESKKYSFFYFGKFKETVMEVFWVILIAGKIKTVNLFGSSSD